MSKGRTDVESEYLTIDAALQQGTKLLESATVSGPRLNAEVLLAHAMRCDRTYLYAHSSDQLTQLAWIHYGRYLHERMKGKPTQYITHRQEFFGREFYVDQNVLIPRPETEHLVDAAVNALRLNLFERVLDVGTGSGAIAISIALECGRKVFASDISLEALKVAKQNRKMLAAPVEFFQADLLDSIRPSSIDLLISNPPYVPGADEANMQREVRDWEPHIALFASNDGFEIYDRLIRGAEQAVRRGGKIVMELGYQSLEGVKEILDAHWSDIKVISDLAGWPRVVIAKLI